MKGALDAAATLNPRSGMNPSSIPSIDCETVQSSDSRNVSSRGRSMPLPPVPLTPRLDSSASGGDSALGSPSTQATSTSASGTNFL